MRDDMTTQIVSPLQPVLSPAQIAFLESLIPGPKAASRCQDAITVGSLIRLNFVAWHESAPTNRRRRGLASFGLTQLALLFLAARNGQPRYNAAALL
jgi:hypothetical protein